MDYRFLASQELAKFFEESDLSVGEVMRSVLQEKFTGVKIMNKSRLTDLTDQQWYEAFENAFKYEQE